MNTLACEKIPECFPWSVFRKYYVFYQCTIYNTVIRDALEN